jgi:hypothetical protein
MTGPFQRRRGTDRHLTTTFIRNARGFLEGAEDGRFPEITRYFLAIAIELSLKAYLLHRGISDDWNRIHIRHDLRKALAVFRRPMGGGGYAEFN